MMVGRVKTRIGVVCVMGFDHKVRQSPHLKLIQYMIFARCMLCDSYSMTGPSEHSILFYTSYLGLGFDLGALHFGYLEKWSNTPSTKISFIVKRCFVVFFFSLAYLDENVCNEVRYLSHTKCSVCFKVQTVGDSPGFSCDNFNIEDKVDF